MDAIGLVVEQACSRAEAARSLGVNANMLRRWIEGHEKDGAAFRGNGVLTQEQEENRELRKRVKKLEMEKEILKKATVFFADCSHHQLPVARCLFGDSALTADPLLK